MVGSRWYVACVAFLLSMGGVAGHGQGEKVLWQDRCDRLLSDYQVQQGDLQAELDPLVRRSDPTALRLIGQGSFLLTPGLEMPGASILECRLTVRGDAAAYLAFVRLSDEGEAAQLLGEAPLTRPGGGGWLRPVLRLDRRSIAERLRVAVRVRKEEREKPLWIDDVQVVGISEQLPQASGNGRALLAKPVALRGWVQPEDLRLVDNQGHWQVQIQRLYLDRQQAGAGALPVEIRVGAMGGGTPLTTRVAPARQAPLFGPMPPVQLWPMVLLSIPAFLWIGLLPLCL